MRVAPRNSENNNSVSVSIGRGVDEISELKYSYGVHTYFLIGKARKGGKDINEFRF